MEITSENISSISQKRTVKYSNCAAVLIHIIWMILYDESLFPIVTEP